MGDELKQAGDLEQDLAMRLAIAEQRAEAIPKLATQQVGMINALAQVDAQETLSIAGARQEAQAQEAALQGELYQTTGQTQYSGAYYEALIQSQAISSIASSDIQNIRDVAQAQASQVKGSAQAQVAEYGHVSGIQAEGTAGQASAQAAAISDQAGVHADRTARLADVQVIATGIQSQIDATGGMSQAAIQAGEVSRSSAIQVAETASVAGIRVNQKSIESYIASELSANLAAMRANFTARETEYRVAEIQGSAAEDYRGDTAAALVRANASRAVAVLRTDSQIVVAGSDAGHKVYDAKNRQKGAHFRADTDLEGTRFEADRSSDLVRYRADRGYEGSVASSDSQLQSAKYDADSDHARRVAAAETEGEARRYGADQDLAGTRHKEDVADARQRAQFAAIGSKWVQLLGYLMGSLSPRAVPGFDPNAPNVPLRPLFLPSQIRQIINRARGDQIRKAEKEKRKAEQDYAGRGCGPTSGALVAAKKAIDRNRDLRIATLLMDTKLDLLARNAGFKLELQVMRSEAALAIQEGYVAADEAAIRLQVSLIEDLTQLLAGL
ncbi:MAG: hypothetical protein ABS79_00590 [Planctomycetes bacterium SCN 63-9]|nr:MAG: hypothetical protein ABS79_00590 [Planctomycetes bacterium SCN 63-9]